MPNRILIVLAALALLPWSYAAAGEGRARIPVIFDTDIGDDIDDTWALGMLLKVPDVDIKLIIGDQHKALYRTKLIAKFLQAAGRTDIPIGIGVGVIDEAGGPQSRWIEGYNLKKYPGKIHENGIQAMIDIIMNSPEPVTVLAIGPVPNIAEALRREPRIASKARFVGMHGSVRLGYGGSKTIHAEYNVKADVKACQAAFTAPWDMVITPLDTCGLVHLRGAKYAAVRDSKDPIAAAIIENYRHWAAANNNPGNADNASSTLFDTVAVYLVYSQDLLNMETLKIRVNDEGFTVIDPAGQSMAVATSWKDMPAFEDHLVQLLTGPSPKR